MACASTGHCWPRAAPRSEWLAREGVAHVDDPSNANTSLTRNRIRHDLLPVLEQVFPQFRETFGRTARHAAQAQSTLEELAALDLACVGVPPQLEALRRLGRSRQANLLRHWLKSQHGQQASAAQMDELLDQVAACATRGHRLRIKVAQGFVMRAGEHLQFEPA